MMKRVAKKKAVRNETALRFGTYPYTAVRVLAMRSLLLGHDDYVRMEKMGMSEIIRFLEERHYKAEIDSLASQFRGLELINLALNANLAGTVNKLLRISLHDEVRKMIMLYSTKWILNNIKIVVRVRMKGLDEKYIDYGVIPIEPTSLEYCRSMAKAELLALAKEIERLFSVGSEEFMELYGKSDLTGIENRLDMEYYKVLYAASRNIKLKAIKEFIQKLVDLMNIKNIVKLKNAGIEKSEIEKFVIGDPTKLTKKLLEADDVAGALKESKYAVLAEGIEEDVANLETNIERFLLQYSAKLLHSKLTTISTIFGFLLAKEIELRNLRLVVNSRGSGLDEQFVRKNLIMIPSRVML